MEKVISSLETSAENFDARTEALTKECHQYRVNMAKAALELDRIVAGQGTNPDEIEKLATQMLQLTNEHKSVIAYNTEAGN